MKYLAIFICSFLPTLSYAQKWVNDENTWQQILHQYKGNAVVICHIASASNDQLLKKAAKLHETQQQFKGKNVVFLTCIQQRDKHDSDEYLKQCMATLAEQGLTDNIYYVSATVSVEAMAEDAIERNWGIYGPQGLIHHHAPWKFNLDKSFNEQAPTPTLSLELDTVLMGKGRYYEKNPTQYLCCDELKLWTLGYAAGPYLVYHAGNPKEPLYRRTTDSVYQQITFMQQQFYIEDSVVLKEGAFNPKLYRREYSTEYFWGTPKYNYLLDKKTNSITVNDNKGKLYKRFRIVLLSPKFLVLENL